MKNLFLFFFLLSCATPISNSNVKNNPLKFNEDLTFEEYGILLIKYAETNPYPNIN